MASLFLGAFLCPTGGLGAGVRDNHPWHCSQVPSDAMQCVGLRPAGCWAAFYSFSLLFFSFLTMQDVFAVQTRSEPQRGAFQTPRVLKLEKNGAFLLSPIPLPSPKAH